jgi:murein DD-endopeptidase MepM/ murein hydrolase activator NlpD
VRHAASFGRVSGNTKQRKGIAPALFYTSFAVLLAGNALLGTALLLSSDIRTLLNGHNAQVVEAYETRIAQLRVEVDRLQSRNYAQSGDINLQLQELANQQDTLLEQHQLVRALVDKANELGIETEFNAQTGALDLSNAAQGLSPREQVEATATAVAQMMGETQAAMTSIAQTANSRADAIANELSGLGIVLPISNATASGGPLLPPQGIEVAANSIADANAVMGALFRYRAARSGIESAPIHMPITTRHWNSSSYGNRKDPFTGQRAFHSGVDFAAPSGTTVFSAGKGVVTFVGSNGGYGQSVEVTHDNGLLTRYAHLSGYLAKLGQEVNTGTPIGKVGSTGRSTGPHLHFEVRKADNPLNPNPFLQAGKRLAAILG